MHYIVSERFYDAASALIGIAVEEENSEEMDLAMRFIAELAPDTPETRKYYGEDTE
jgi:hypothetical protein